MYKNVLEFEFNFLSIWRWDFREQKNRLKQVIFIYLKIQIENNAKKNKQLIFTYFKKQKKNNYKKNSPKLVGN